MICLDQLRRGNNRKHRGVTLVELLISVALTLLVILAIVRVFEILGGNVTESRSILELSAQLRNASGLLQSDLDGLTVRPDPPINPLRGAGYFEIVEGIRSDQDNDGDQLVDTDRYSSSADAGPNGFAVKSFDGSPGGTTDPQFTPLLMLPPPNSAFLNDVRGLLGDTDDVWMGTVRSTGKPFRGRFFNVVNGRAQPAIIESNLAEVIWWIEPVQGPNGDVVDLRLIRRVLLIVPELVNAVDLGSGSATKQTVIEFLSKYDVSVRPEYIRVPMQEGNAGSIRIRGNSLEDLTERRNRFAHWPDDFALLAGNLGTVGAGMTNIRTIADPAFPYRLNRNFMVAATDLSDVVANDAMAMDVRVFDPLAPVFRMNNGPYVLTPSDPGYRPFLAAQGGNAGNFIDSLGAYVDLGYNVRADGSPFSTVINSHFSGPPAFIHWSNQNRWLINTPFAPRGPAVYDTWSTLYEADGLNQDNSELSNGGANLNATHVDQGSDGFDQNGNGVVDDYLEKETIPPYPHALRGMEVILRLREPNSQQIRQASVVTDFIKP